MVESAEREVCACVYVMSDCVGTTSKSMLLGITESRLRVFISLRLTALLFRLFSHPPSFPRFHDQPSPFAEQPIHNHNHRPKY